MTCKDILGKQWLDSIHRNLVNKLILDSGFSLNGFQETKLTPIFQKNGTWQFPINGLKSQKPPFANIHYNSQKHWVTSLQYENCEIYLLESNSWEKMENCLNDSLKIQLAQLNGKLKITVNIPYIQQ